MPGLTDMIIATEPLLPPVAMPRSDAMADPSDEADSADTQLRAPARRRVCGRYNGEETEEDLYMSLYEHSGADVSLSHRRRGWLTSTSASRRSRLMWSVHRPTTLYPLRPQSRCLQTSCRSTCPRSRALSVRFRCRASVASACRASRHPWWGDSTPGFFMLTGDPD